MTTPIKEVKERRLTDGEGIKGRFSIGESGKSEEKSPFGKVELKDIELSEKSEEKSPLPFQNLAAGDEHSFFDRKSSLMAVGS